MWVIGTTPVRANASCVSSPGTWVTIGAAGEKPSLVLIALGSKTSPDALVGIDAGRRSSRRPVSVLESARVKWSLGYGNRHSVPSGVIGSQRSAVSMATPTGLLPSQRRGSRFIVLALDLTLPRLVLAFALSLVSMQLLTSRRPFSVSASRLDALVARAKLELLALCEPLVGVALADEERDLDLGLARRLRRDLHPPVGDEPRLRGLAERDAHLLLVMVGRPCRTGAGERREGEQRDDYERVPCVSHHRAPLLRATAVSPPRSTGRDSNTGRSAAGVRRRRGLEPAVRSGPEPGDRRRGRRRSRSPRASESGRS